MKINIIKDIEKKPLIWKGINNYYGVTNGLGATKLGYLILKQEYLDGDDGINSKIDGIRNVSITYKEFQERKKRDDNVRDNDYEGYDWDMVNNPLYFNIQWDENRERYTKEQHGTIPYIWSSEVNFAYSYLDITEVTDMYGRNSEYYYTPEVLEVLEKLKEALESWNNQEERQKMIEEYEKNNQGKT